jgi:hypothetical protein
MSESTIVQFVCLYGVRVAPDLVLQKYSGLNREKSPDNRQVFFQNRHMALTPIPACDHIPYRREGANSLVADG